MGQRQERHLPGPAAVTIAIEVELVHGHAADVRMLAKAQRILGQDLGRAADDGRLAVYHHVTRDHAHVVLAEKVNQVEELLADQRLYGCRVVGAAVRAVGDEEHAHSDHALARARGRAQDHVVARGQVKKGLLLMVPEPHAP